ncbi:MAG: hypothetical protein AB1521_03905 [Bacteroidota bacterium]
MKKHLSIPCLLLLLISISSINQAQDTVNLKEIDLLKIEVLVETYDSKFLVGVKYSDDAQRFKIKSVYDKSGKKLEGKVAGFVNPIAAQYQDLKKLSVATNTRAVWNLEQDLLENSQSTNIISQKDTGVVVRLGKTYSEIPASGYFGYSDAEMKQVIVRFYVDEEGTLITYNIIKEDEKLCSEVAIVEVNGETIFLKEREQREIPDYETQSGEKHKIRAIRDADGKLQVLSNYFGEYERVPFLKGYKFSLEEFMNSR